MTKKELQEYYWVNRDIQNLNEKLWELDAMASGRTSRLSGTSRSTSGPQDKMAELTVNLVMMKEELSKRIRVKHALLTEVEKAVEHLPPREKYLIRARYIEMKKWEEISEDMHYSYKHVHRIHNEALRLLETA